MKPEKQTNLVSRVSRHISPLFLAISFVTIATAVAQDATVPPASITAATANLATQPPQLTITGKSFGSGQPIVDLD